MEPRSLAPLVGVAGCLAVLALLLYPYLVADGTGVYYGTAAVNPLVAGLLALLGVIVFAAGREGRTDPVLAAGATLALGVFGVAILAAWAVTARVDAVQVTGTHRWATVAAGAVVPLAAGWYARGLGLV